MSPGFILGIISKTKMKAVICIKRLLKTFSSGVEKRVVAFKASSACPPSRLRAKGHGHALYCSL